MYPQNPYPWCLVWEDWGQIDDATGELGSTGNGNLMRSFAFIVECAFDQQHKPFQFYFFDALAMKLCHGVKKKQTKNSQC